MRLRLLCKCDEGLQVSVANQVSLPALFEARRSEVANGLQHQEAWRLEVGKPPKQALVRQLIEPVEDIPADIPCRATDRLELLQAATPCKDRHAGHQAAVAGVEHVIAPKNCAA